MTWKLNAMNNKKAGGNARAEKLSPERRKEISKLGIQTRWENERKKEFLPHVILKRDDLNLAGVKIPCAIIEDIDNPDDAVRVLTDNGISTAIFGTTTPSGASKRLKTAANESGLLLPVFLAPSQLKPFIKESELEILKPISYVDGTKILVGYDARILPIVCDIWLRARAEDALLPVQLDKAKKAEVLMRALAHVGIIALVDEATGFQSLRAKDALAKILEAFVEKELQPYVKKFPVDYYKEICRLRELPFNALSVKRPSYFGHITNDIVYRRLAPGVWKELKKLASKEENRKTKPHLHRYLTSDIGDPRLRELITKVVTIMQLSSNWHDFKTKLERILPAFNQTMQLPFEYQDDNGVGL